ncbi:MAG: serine/threonine-protein kinase [Acidimicrobiales bacterium]
MSSPADVRRVIVDRYELLDPIGQGPVGVVWRALDRQTGREVAVREVKLPEVLDEAEQSVLAQKVLSEARSAARLDHPGVVAVLDVVSDDGGPAGPGRRSRPRGSDGPLVVPELVLAPTLAEWVADNGPLSPAQAGVIGLELLDALAAAHRRHLVHRDVRPSNVLLTSSGAARLADFGVASIVDEPKVTGSGGVPDPSYLAPEQTGSAGASNLSDLWSLGATLYFAVEGVSPFEAAAPASAIESVVGDPPRRPLRAGALQPVLDALLVKDPLSRPDDEATRLLLEEATRSAAAGDTPPAPMAPDSDSLPPGQGAAQAQPLGRSLSAAQREDPPPSGGDELHGGRDGATRAADTDVSAQEPWFFRLPVDVVPPPPLPEPPSPQPDAAERQDGERRGRFPRGTWIALLAVVVGAVMVALIITGGRQVNRPSTKSSAAPTAPASWVPYTDATTGFALRYPPNWEVRPVGTQTFFLEPTTGAFFAVNHQPPLPSSPMAEWLDQEKGFAAAQPTYNRLQMVPTTYRGLPAAIWEYTNGEPGASVHRYNLDFTAGRFSYVLSFQSRASDWPAAQGLFDSFKAGFTPGP